MRKFKEIFGAINEIEAGSKKVLSVLSKSKSSFATNEEDWNNYRDEEIARDISEELKRENSE